jgi:hypothetical protein
VRGCSHKTSEDHSVMTANGRLWICSACGIREKWNHRWQYFGNLECRNCGTANIEFVTCSDNCRQRLAA